MRGLLVVGVSLIVTACGSAGDKSDPFGTRNQIQSGKVAECGQGFNPIPVDRPDTGAGAIVLPDLAAIPQGTYAAKETQFLIGVRDRKRNALTHITHGTPGGAVIRCTNFDAEDRFGMALPGFASWIKGTRETVIARSFNFLWNQGAHSVSVTEDWSPEDPSMATVLRFFPNLRIYDLGKSVYEVRGERLEVVGPQRIHVLFSFVFRRN